MGSVYSTPISSNKKKAVVLALGTGGLCLVSFGSLASGATLFSSVQVKHTAYRASMDVFIQDDVMAANNNEINPHKLYNVSFRLGNTTIDVLLTKDHDPNDLELPYLMAKHGDNCTETFLNPHAANETTASEHTSFKDAYEKRKNWIVKGGIWLITTCPVWVTILTVITPLAFYIAVGVEMIYNATYFKYCPSYFPNRKSLIKAGIAVTPTGFLLFCLPSALSLPISGTYLNAIIVTGCILARISATVTVLVAIATRPRRYFVKKLAKEAKTLCVEIKEVEPTKAEDAESQAGTPSDRSKWDAWVELTTNMSFEKLSDGDINAHFGNGAVKLYKAADPAHIKLSVRLYEISLRVLEFLNN